MPSTPHREPPVEVEVERLEPGQGEREWRGEAGGPEAGPGPSRPGTGLGGFGPVLAGVLLDMADLITPMGLKQLALPVGFFVGYAVAGKMGLGLKQRVVLGVVGAAYCSLPATSKLPLGTLVGLLYKAGAFAGR
jgi:hypothetical protein